MKKTLLLIIALIAATAFAYAKTPESHVLELTPSVALPQPTAKKPVVIDFNADWCGPCRQFRPVFDKTAGQLHRRATFVSVNVDRNPGLAEKFSISSIPCIVILRQGAEPTVRVGSMTYDEFNALLRPLIP